MNKCISTLGIKINATASKSTGLSTDSYSVSCAVDSCRQQRVRGFEWLTHEAVHCLCFLFFGPETSTLTMTTYFYCCIKQDVCLQSRLWLLNTVLWCNRHQVDVYKLHILYTLPPWNHVKPKKVSSLYVFFKIPKQWQINKTATDGPYRHVNTMRWGMWMICHFTLNLSRLFFFRSCLYGYFWKGIFSDFV